jgi:RNA recognition motif-containing protein
VRPAGLSRHDSHHTFASAAGFNTKFIKLTLGEMMENKLYVGNLSYSTTEDDLQTLFAQAGAVTSVTVIKDRDTGRSKGFGFVEMATAADAQNAISMLDGKPFQQRTITVNQARPREERGGNRAGKGAPFTHPRAGLPGDPTIDPPDPPRKPRKPR